MDRILRVAAVFAWCALASCGADDSAVISADPYREDAGGGGSEIFSEAGNDRVHTAAARCLDPHFGLPREFRHLTLAPMRKSAGATPFARIRSRATKHCARPSSAIRPTRSARRASFRPRTRAPTERS